MTTAILAAIFTCAVVFAGAYMALRRPRREIASLQNWNFQQAKLRELKRGMLIQ